MNKPKSGKHKKTKQKQKGNHKKPKALMIKA